MGGGGGLTLGSDLIVQAVETFGLGTVKVEPPITDEVSLIENGTIGAQKGVFGKTTESVSGTNVESLAFGVGIGIVT